ncbi:ornithine carbamoyltransferase [Leucobacter sp. UCD-THU]|uniref:ornithine carbamoyltransferase n=1 Tax=Leucobacter sp. UCD-THU TaxID=1292023 RepID=UPI00037133FF|nr:ornithine carbamoyltransferase [Leucobacter sp. UCD-THU]EYT54138.1 ornithine carbamoyltransferase [Leucobacter sp. UCD-THU]
MTRHFLRDDDLTPAEQREVLELAERLKRNPYAERPLEGPQSVAVFFDKTSTRTRFSFAAGIAELGGSPIVVNPGEAQLGAKETISDTARVLSRMVSMIVWRTFAHAGLEEMAANATVPVINSLSDDFHPCQILADLQTIREHRAARKGGELSGLTATYVGDAANNMGHSYLLGFATAGMHIRVAGPDGYHPREDIVADAKRIAAETGGSVTILTDPVEAVRGADAVITDTWVSMGQEGEKAERVATFGAYRVTPELMGQAADDAIFLHCLPAYREYEVAPDVIDGPQSVVWDEAENRVHAQKALMAWLLQQG